MGVRAALGVAICLTLVPSASGSAQRIITERDSGNTFRVSRGHDVTLRLSNRFQWSGPRVKGSAVRLIPVNYFADPGFQEWTIRARARGSARVSAVGHGETSKLFRIRLIVP